MTKYLANAFSLNMVDGPNSFPVCEGVVEASQVMDLLGDDFTNAVGHQNTVDVLDNTFGFGLGVANRVSVSLEPGDLLVVAQYKGPRLNEGVTTLPDGARFEFWVFRVP